MRSRTEQTYQERILRVLVFIQQHLDETLELDRLARVAHFSPYHFHRLFRGMVGESVMEHVRRLRLERAAHRLKFSTQPITRIAFEAGYETHEAFTRAFRAMFEDSPSHFRQAHRTLPFQDTPSGVHFAADAKVDGFRPQRTVEPLDVRIEHIAPRRVAFIRHVGSYDHVGDTWGRLMAWAGRQGVLSGRPAVLGIVHDDPEVTPAEKIRYDACVVVDDSCRAEGEIGVHMIDGGEFAVTRHRGPYDRLGAIYARLCGQWLPANGREPKSAPALEVYWNSPRDTDPPDLLTDIYIPLAET